MRHRGKRGGSDYGEMNEITRGDRLIIDFGGPIIYGVG